MNFISLNQALIYTPNTKSYGCDTV